MDTNKSYLSVGIVQENPIVGDIQGNLNLAKRGIKRLVKEGSPDVILFSEMFLTGYPPEDLLLREDLFSEIEKSLKNLAQEFPAVHIVIGYPKKEGEEIYNCAGLVFNGRVQKEYKKQELPNFKVFDEKRYFTPGNSVCVFDIKGVKLAITICEDIWHKKAVMQAADEGAKIILNLNASPFHKRKTEERRNLLSSHCIEHSLSIVYVNQVGGQDELVFDGHSMVITPDESNWVLLPEFEVSLEQINFLLEKVDSPQLDASMKIASDDEMQSLLKALTLGTKDYVDKNGFSGAIIGSSGGIDSALTAVIAVKALGHERVKTFMMPFKYTADISQEDAMQLAENLKIEHEEIKIHEIFESFNETLRLNEITDPSDKTQENLQSRIRGVILMAMSNKTGSLVLTTGNKSETAVGYSTLYGDTAGGFAVLKDVPKTLVYELARYLNLEKEVIPQRIIDRPPSAELAPDQKDSDSLPDYGVLDQIIELYVEKDMGYEDIVKEGFDQKTVKRIIKLIDRNEYKRRQGPPGVRISNRGFGKDRRYPITNKFTQ
ncbi:MAG: NAD+ synthase [Gammaproteobacteria bacterium]